MKTVKSPEGKPYEKWLMSLGLFSLEQWRLRQDLIAGFNFLMRVSREAGTDLFGDH